MKEIKILKIKNCFQCYYHSVKFGLGYCEKTGKTQAYCWDNEFPPFCPLLNIEQFVAEIKLGD